MKKLIKISDYYYVIDDKAEIKKGDWLIENNIYINKVYSCEGTLLRHDINLNRDKIICSTRDKSPPSGSAMPNRLNTCKISSHSASTCGARSSPGTCGQITRTSPCVAVSACASAAKAPAGNRPGTSSATHTRATHRPYRFLIRLNIILQFILHS